MYYRLCKGVGDSKKSCLSLRARLSLVNEPSHNKKSNNYIFTSTCSADCNSTATDSTASSSPSDDSWVESYR